MKKCFRIRLCGRLWGTQVKYVLIIVPSTIILALILATFLNMGIKGRSFFSSIFYTSYYHGCGSGDDLAVDVQRGLWDLYQFYPE